MSLSAGVPAPDVTFSTADRQEVSLSQFKGAKNVVLAFYPRAFTGGWERELRKFQSMLSDFEQLDAQVLGCSTDAAPPQQAFANHCAVTFPVVADFPAFTGARAFGVFNAERIANSRTTFVIDKQGVVRAVLEDLPQPEDHVTRALEAVKGL